MMELQQKILDAFIGKVVRKDLAFLVKGGLPVPTYVLEYLLGQYCASDDEEIINDGLEKVKQVIRNNYVHRAEAESIKGVIREHGKHRVIDKVTVTLNERSDEYNATFANLGLSGVPIGTEYVRKNPKLLSGNGVWCIVTIGYVSGEDVKVTAETGDVTFTVNTEGDIKDTHREPNGDKAIISADNGSINRAT